MTSIVPDTTDHSNVNFLQIEEQQIKIKIKYFKYEILINTCSISWRRKWKPKEFMQIWPETSEVAFYLWPLWHCLIINQSRVN